MKASFCCSLVGATFGAFRVLSSMMMPARRAAALVVRGAMSGASVVAGRGLARKTGLPLALSRLELRPPTVEGFVTDEAAYPSEVDRCKLDIIEEVREPGGNCVVENVELASSGSSWVGNTGDDAKREAICTSAVCMSGDPMRPFCSRDRPYNARSELGVFLRATAGSLSPMSVFHTSTARRRSNTYTQTGPLWEKAYQSARTSDIGKRQNTLSQGVRIFAEEFIQGVRVGLGIELHLPFFDNL
jgi:hypothetical protein